MDFEGSATMSAGQKDGRESSMDLAALGEIVERFAGKKIVLFGDFVADEFQFGEISRVSREAPVLILRHRNTSVVPGGGANAANNLAALGAKVNAISVVGGDAPGSALIEHFKGIDADTGGMFRAKDWATPTKTRFLAGWTHTVGQQVLRVDREPESGPAANTMAKVLAKLKASLRGADGLAVSDYGFGVATPAAGKDLTEGKKLTQIPVHGSDQAVDVTGAGDTVLAAYTLALAAGASPLEAAQIANIAGGLVVMKRGTAVVTRAELLAAIRTEASGGGS